MALAGGRTAHSFGCRSWCLIHRLRDKSKLSWGKISVPAWLFLWLLRRWFKPMPLKPITRTAQGRSRTWPFRSLISKGLWNSLVNKGVYKSEFHIFFISTMLFSVFGYVGWTGQYGISYDSCITFVFPIILPWLDSRSYLIIQNGQLQLVVSSAAAVTYLLDTHGTSILHILTLINFAKHFLC